MSDSKARLTRELRDARAELSTDRQLVVALIADLAERAGANPDEGFWPSEKVPAPSWYWRATL